MRQSAAENLGELTRMSMRVDQLATDLINNAKMADPAIQEAYLTALRGMLLFTGQRLSPNVLSKAGEALQSMMNSAGMLCCMHCPMMAIFVKANTSPEHAYVHVRMKMNGRIASVANVRHHVWVIVGVCSVRGIDYSSNSPPALS